MGKLESRFTIQIVERMGSNLGSLIEVFESSYLIRQQERPERDLKDFSAGSWMNCCSFLETIHSANAFTQHQATRNVPNDRRVAGIQRFARWAAGNWLRWPITFVQFIA